MKYLNEFKFIKIVLSLTCLEKIIFPKGLKGNIVRGAFGLVFKKLNCKSTPICEEKCINSNCLYGKIFEPYLIENVPSGMKDIPRPFIITHVGLDERDVIYPGESFNIGFNIFGWACDYYGHFITAVKAIGEEGIGPSRGRFIVRSVSIEDILGNKEVIQDEVGVLKSINSFNFSFSFQPECKFVKIEFITPLRIVYNSEVITKPEFYHIFLRLRDRISALLYFHHGISIYEDFKYLELEAREVKTVKSRWKSVELRRRSSKTHLLHDLSGVVGYGVFNFGDSGRVELFAPWLKLGEVVNVGKHAVWGMGEMKVIFDLKLNEKKFSEVENVWREKNFKYL